MPRGVGTTAVVGKVPQAASAGVRTVVQDILWKLALVVPGEVPAVVTETGSGVAGLEIIPGPSGGYL